MCSEHLLTAFHPPQPLLTDMNHTHILGGLCPSVFRSLRGLLIAFIGFTILTASVFAQTATITGRVMNQATGDYLKYAQIQIVGSDKSDISEEGGVYTLTNVPAGQVKLSVTYTGLDTQELSVTVPASGTVQQDINMVSDQYGETVKLGEFKVASAREGNAKAIVEQRIALNLKTVIAADAFGDVSEGNVGEFLKLLPGVSVDYVDNDARSTRIRGLPPKYNTTTMDGHPIANAASSSIATGRQLELEQVSMAAMDTIESTKTPTPDMITANLAGNINAVSKSAFNQKGRSIKYQGSANFNQWNGSFGKSKGWDENEHSKALFGGKVEWVDTFFNGKLGMVATVAHSGAYAEQRIVIGTQTWDVNPDNNATELPQSTSWNFQHGLKPTWRDALMLNFDYKATDDLKLSLRTNYGYYRSEFYNRNWTANSTTAAGSIVNATETIADHLTTSTNSSNNYVRVLGSNQRKSGGTFIISPAASWKHNNLKVDVATSYSQAKNAYTSGQDGYFSLVQADMRGVSWSSNRIADDNVAVNQIATANPNTVISNRASILDLGNYNTGGQVNDERRNSKDQMWSANGDIEIDFPDWRIPIKLKFGAADSFEVRDIHNFQARWSVALAGGPTVAGAVGTVNLQDYREAFSGGVGTVTDINGVTGKTPAPNKWALYRLFQSYGNTDPFSLTNNGPFVAQAANNLRVLLANDFDISENIGAAYAMATIKPMKNLTVVAGLRFEKTKTQGRGFDDKGVDQTLAALGLTALISTNPAIATGTTGIVGSRAKVNADSANRFDYIYYRYGSRITREKTYDNVLPVLQGRYQITKNLITRAAYYGSLLRPDFQSVIGGVSGSESSDGTFTTISVNNTLLKPETANNFDVSVEYYFEPVGVVSAAFFFKDIKDIQVQRPSTNYAGVPDSIKEQLREAGYTDSQLDNGGLNRFTSTINGPKTSLWGYELAYSQELSFLPGAFKGLGVTANYSHYEPEEKRLWALVPNAGDGMALDQANFILRYKIGKFKVQGSATWTDKRISSLGGMNIDSAGNFTPTGTSNVNVTAYQSARTVISTNMEYELHRYATVFLGVNNLLNSAKFNYAEREVFTTRNGNYGASINVGVKGSF
jgi:TonB-dependent receptor